MRHFPISLLMVVAVTAAAGAEPPRQREKPVKLKKVKIRAANAYTPRIGCTDQHQTSGISCDGIERYRSGMGSTQVTYDTKTSVKPVVMYQVTSTQSGTLVASQAIAAVGIRKVVGRGWIQAGPGVARMDTAKGPKSVGSIKTLLDPRPALAGGVGVNLSKSEDPATLAIDFSSTIDSKDDEPQIYQIGASVVRRF